MEEKGIFSLSRKKKQSQGDGTAHVKKRKLDCKFHKQHAVPMSFFEEAMGPNFRFDDTAGGTFGVEAEGYVRQCYVDLKNIFEAEVKAFVEEDGRPHTRLVEIRGSSGVGKSAFLAYLLAVLRKGGMENVAIFHSAKNSDTISGSIWIGGQGLCRNCPWSEIRPLLQSHMHNLEYLIMDGCSVTFSLENFEGIVLLAASPSVCTRRLRKTILINVVLNMPTWSKTETLQIAKLVDADQDTVEDNFMYMNGIVRYMLIKGMAKNVVLEAIGVVNPKSLVEMLSTQIMTEDKTKENIAVHALVQWNTKKDTNGRFMYNQKPSFEMVSRFAEKLVAEKLAALETHELDSSWRMLQPLSGAEGYAGALYEAYAIRRFLAGGDLSLFSLKDGRKKIISVPVLDKPVVVEWCNTLTPSTVPLDNVWKKKSDDEKEWLACLLWPTTTNFPTFDAFYFHTDGEVYALQMTISSHHPLTNGGAYQASQYFFNIKSAQSPYPAVFVAPPSVTAGYPKQPFTGIVLNRNKVVMAEVDAVRQMDNLFEQWVLSL